MIFESACMEGFLENYYTSSFAERKNGQRYIVQK
jgi:hypothetical protein